MKTPLDACVFNSKGKKIHEYKSCYDDLFVREINLTNFITFLAGRGKFLRKEL